MTTPSTRRKREGFFIGLLKAKAAANPAAADAILAGVAWRLYRRPPIASLLVGAGIAALARTDPNDHSLTPRRLAQRAAHRAQELKDRASAQIAEMTEGAVGSAQETLQEWSSAAERALESVTHKRRRAASPEALSSYRSSSQSGFHADPYQESPAVYAPERSPQDERESRQWRDAYLLGFAALALGAAIGVARRRKAPGKPEEILSTQALRA